MLRAGRMLRNAYNGLFTRLSVPMINNAQNAYALFLAARQGDHVAFGQLLESYRNYLSLLARVQIGRRLQKKVDPADLVQETFLVACQSFAQLRSDDLAAFIVWLRKIFAGQLAHLIRRYCVAEARNIMLEQSIEQELNSSSDWLVRGLSDPNASPSDAAAQQEEVVRLGNALEQLPADYRDVIVLRQLVGLSTNEIAARMERSADSVQKLWVRGLDALRKLIENR